jgi:hypothetical protein
MEIATLLPFRSCRVPIFVGRARQLTSSYLTGKPSWTGNTIVNIQVPAKQTSPKQKGSLSTPPLLR